MSTSCHSVGNRKLKIASRAQVGVVVGALVVWIGLLALFCQTHAFPATMFKQKQGLKNATNTETPVPVIGVLTQVLRDYKRFADKRQLHLVASYVKWIESSGAQVIPILLNKDDDYYVQVFKKTNGLLLPGGDNLLDPRKRTPMMVAAQKLYRLAVEANDRGDFYPIWGTCLGFELLSVLTADKNMLSNCSANDIVLKMDFVEGGKMFEPSNYMDVPLGNTDYSKAMLELMSKENVTYNFHHKCLLEESLKRVELDKFYRTLAYSTDANGLRFISAFEAYRYPFFGVQFHPEKPSFEFVVKRDQKRLPHSRHARAVSRYFADFFVAQARKSGHRMGVNEIRNDLIYAHTPTYTAPMRDMYEQRYLFPYDESSELSTEEFIDRDLSDDEQANEDV